ncbi:MAG: tetratricopeptide repeat protein [Planctomycetota bacterium]
MWGTNDLLAARRPVAERIAIAIAAGAIAALSVSTWQQIGYRKDSITAYRRALDLTPDNHVAYAGLGCAFAEMHRLDEAVENLRAAVRIKPDWGPAHGNLAIALAMQGRMQDARAELRRAWQCHWSIPEGRAAELRAWIDGEHEPQ